MTTHSSPDLSGKTALVTGATRGLGHEAAIGLAKAGAHVIALGRTVGALEALDDEIKAAGGSASLVPVDLTDDEAMDALAPALTDRFGKLDIMVGAAGVLGELAPLPDITPKVWREVFDTNLHANWSLIRNLDPLLRASGAGRAIFFTSSVGGEKSRAFWGAYAASKAALEMMATTYALEANVSGVRVAIIDPGAMRTNMRAQAMPGEDPNTLPDPSEIIPLVLHAASDDYDSTAERLVFREWKEDGRL